MSLGPTSKAVLSPWEEEHGQIWSEDGGPLVHAKKGGRKSLINSRESKMFSGKMAQLHWEEVNFMFARGFPLAEVA